jgi:sugar lactone lactonase YvrE
MRTVMALLVLTIALGVAWILASPVPIAPLPWTAPPNPGFNGAFEFNAHLAGVEKPIPDLGPGPEDVTRGPDGLIYTGLEDGRIMRFDSAGDNVAVFAETGGRPLGLRFDARGTLWVADAYRGIVSVSPGGKVEYVVSKLDGEAFGFTNSLAVAADGTIWFTDASRRFQESGKGTLEFWESRPTGRLLSHNPGSGETKVHLDSLDFANGVALGPADAWLLMNETFGPRILRYWLAGPRAGEREVVLEHLPGFPDNVSFDGEIFWVAIVGPRVPILDRIRALPPFFRKVVYRVPEQFRVSGLEQLGMVLGLDTLGQVRYNLQGRDGSYFGVTGVAQFDGWLWMGGINARTVGRTRVPDLAGP